MAASPSPALEVRGRIVYGIIHVLTEDISDDYPEYLREQGISYIFYGKEKLAPVLMMEKLYDKFGIKKTIISGGAYAYWTLLSRGLVDEIKTILVPVVDGKPQSNTLFKRLEDEEAQPVALSLADVERSVTKSRAVSRRCRRAWRCPFWSMMMCWPGVPWWSPQRVAKLQWRP